MGIHKYRLMRPHSALAERLPGGYPESINVALERYLQLVSTPPQFEEAEWNLLRDACNGWATQTEPPEILAQALALQVADEIACRHLDLKWQIDGQALALRLQALSPVEAIAVIHAIERFWGAGE